MDLGINPISCRRDCCRYHRDRLLSVSSVRALTRRRATRPFRPVFFLAQSARSFSADVFAGAGSPAPDSLALSDPTIPDLHPVISGATSRPRQCAWSSQTSRSRPLGRRLLPSVMVPALSARGPVSLSMIKL
jgi:hypothetical protein